MKGAGLFNRQGLCREQVLTGRDLCRQVCLRGRIYVSRSEGGIYVGRSL